MADELNVDLYDPVKGEALVRLGDSTGIFNILFNNNDRNNCTIKS